VYTHNKRSVEPDGLPNSACDVDSPWVRFQTNLSRRSSALRLRYRNDLRDVRQPFAGLEGQEADGSRVAVGVGLGVVPPAVASGVGSTVGGVGMAVTAGVADDGSATEISFENGLSDPLRSYAVTAK
jgi:hypothetical protein